MFKGRVLSLCIKTNRIVTTLKKLQLETYLKGVFLFMGLCVGFTKHKNQNLEISNNELNIITTISNQFRLAIAINCVNLPLV